MTVDEALKLAEQRRGAEAMITLADEIYRLRNELAYTSNKLSMMRRRYEEYRSTYKGDE